jgi:1-phosphatidylinositol-4-phosphate 5-kinase
VKKELGTEPDHDLKIPMKIDMTEEEEILVINEDVRVTEYAPEVFGFLRHLDNIDKNIVKESLSAEKNRDSVFKAGESQGKSGSFFFFSHDKNFIIKTMTESDLSTFKKLFMAYFKGVASRPNSLLARIYGIYTVKKEEVEPVHLILMGNTKKSNDKNIVNVFDLKGSFIHREVDEKNLKPTATLKDINLLNACKKKILLKFKKEDQITIMENLERDAEMLRSHNIMDYSLLFAIEKNVAYMNRKGPLSKTTLSTNSNDEEVMKEMSKTFNKNRHTFLSRSGKFIYHLAIIDYLQDFNFDKRLESMIKTVINKEGAEISAIEPNSYSRRYVKFMKEKVIID